VKAAPELADGDVHVDWHMTPGEWRQLCTVLWEHAEDTPYIGRLIEAGKIPPPFGRPQAAATEVVHLSPRDATYVAPCCGQTFSDLSRMDRTTNDPELVTCKPQTAPEQPCVTDQEKRMPNA
jgi:hypothetical protein